MMMVLHHFPGAPVSTASLAELLAQWAARTSRRTFALLALTGTTGLAVVAFTGFGRWPLAAISAAVLVLGAWGAARRYASAHPTRAARALDTALAIVGTFAALAALGGLFLWVLGPKWSH